MILHISNAFLTHCVFSNCRYWYFFTLWKKNEISSEYNFSVESAPYVSDAHIFKFFFFGGGQFVSCTFFFTLINYVYFVPIYDNLYFIDNFYNWKSQLKIILKFILVKKGIFGSFNSYFKMHQKVTQFCLNHKLNFWNLCRKLH